MRPRPVAARSRTEKRARIRRRSGGSGTRSRNGERCAVEPGAARVREFPVPAGTHPHDVAPARDGGVWYTAQHTGELGWLEPEDREGAAHATRGRLGTARRHRRPGRSAVDHGRRPQRHRARRPPHAEGSTLPSAGQREREPEHGDVRPPRRALVHGAERNLRPPRSEGRQGACVRSASRRGAVRDHDDAVGWRLLRVARGQLPRPDRRSHRQGGGPPAADPWPGGAPRMVGLARPDLVSEWNAGKVGMYDPQTKRWREWRVPGASPMIYAVYVDERDKVWLTDFGAQCALAVRPPNGAVHPGGSAERERRGAAAARSRGRGVGRGVRHGQARRRLHALKRRAVAEAPSYRTPRVSLTKPSEAAKEVQGRRPVEAVGAEDTGAREHWCKGRRRRRIVCVPSLKMGPPESPKQVPPWCG